MKKIIFFIFAIISFRVHAQSPGLAGKHFGVHGNIGMIPAFHHYLSETHQDPEAYGYASTLPGIGMNLTPGLGAEYVATKSLVLGVDRVWMLKQQPLHLYYARGDNAYVYNAFLGETKIKGDMYGFYLKIYPFRRKGVIAPMGHYNKLEILTGSVYAEAGDLVITDYVTASEFIVFPMELWQYEPKSDISELELEPVKVLFLKYAFGGEQILYNKITIDYNMDINFPLMHYEEVSHEQLYTDANMYYKNWMRNNTWNSIGIAVNVSIGGMLF